ncbi:MAG: hypothetical protein DWQ45_22210 [Planctomycetota bacterium]|nr:MAG: hypothetical protein DWQ29_21370 [Planctomycetota bacterium]REK21126.1 MAG: hypothetical protein DWQ41_22175 [Planctomycetota bacterium]REK29535.1 MAG: hypothetical protein DWQ45_22210 [Planctomycetota bacterium]
MAQSRSSQRPANRPEVKFGPFPGGISVAVWQNEVNTEGGSRTMRSITVSPRRYRDSQSGEWRDSASYRPSDIPAILFGLNKAQEYIFSNPLAGQEERDFGSQETRDNDEVPY